MGNCNGVDNPAPNNYNNSNKQNTTTRNGNNGKSGINVVTHKSQKQQNNQELFKSVLIGNSSVGKSSFTSRIAKNEFKMDAISTIGLEYTSKDVRVETNRGPVDVKLQLWDTAGQEKYRAITSAYYRGSHAIVVVYSITDAKSFNDINRWVSEICAHTSDCLIVMVGNKCDMENDRKVNRSDAISLAAQYNCKHFETSAKTGQGCEEVVNYIVKTLLSSKSK